jgi:hypothetical protein
MSPSSRADMRLVVGGTPRADLLPPELELEKKARGTRRGLITLMVLVFVFVVVGYIAVSGVAAGAQFALDSANARTGELIQEQGKYIEVRQAQAQVDAAVEARRIGTSTEVDWLAMNNYLAGKLPEGMTVQAWTVQTSTPFTTFTPTTVPFEQPRQIEVLLGGLSKSYPDLAGFIDNTEDMPGFADATPNEVKYVPQAGVYSWQITYHLNEGAFTQRFAATTEGTN